jgi:hypothetical protein
VISFVAGEASKIWRLASSPYSVQLRLIKGLEKENSRLKKIVADLELDKLILKESLDYL